MLVVAVLFLFLIRFQTHDASVPMKTKHPVFCSRPGWLLCLLGLFLVLARGSALAQLLPLSITCPRDIEVLTCGDGRVVQYPAPVVVGGCEGRQVVCQPPSGSTFPVGVTTVTCRVIDSCGNADSCSFNVIVRRDIEPPKIECPTNFTVFGCQNAAGGCGAIVNYPSPVASDNSGAVTVTCNPPSGSFLPCGENIITCVAEDRCGNKSICRFVVTVREGGAAPSLQCPSDRVITTCSNTAVLNYPLPVVSPAGTTVVCTPPPGTVLPLGAYTVTCVASNACGVAQCSFDVAIRPAPRVSIQCPTNTLTYTIPCGSNCVPVFYPLPTVVNGALESIFPPPGTCLPEGVHVITARATNECGAALCEFPIRVVKGQGEPPVIRCPQDLTLVTCSNCVPLRFPRPVVVNGAIEAIDPAPGTCLPPGEHVVKVVATNECGRAVCEFRVKVVPADERPRMTISRVGDDVVVCWTKTCRCFKLQGTRSLNRPIQWVDVQEEPVDLGDRLCVRVPISLRMEFFRLVQCDQPTATVYDVTGLPITATKAAKLADVLGLSRDQVIFGDGSVRFVDPRRFQAIPTRTVTDPEIIGPLASQTENDKGELAFEGIDFGALRQLRVPGALESIERFSLALREAAVLPENGRLVARHTLFEATDEKGNELLRETPIDTQVHFQFELDGIPLIGPGAKLGIHYGPEGEPTSLIGSYREHKPFREIPILSVEEAARRCQRMYPQLGTEIRPRLVYVAPSLLLPAVQKLVPCFECAGEGVAGGETVNLLRTVIPATDDPEFTPDVVLEADAAGVLVTAKAQVRGGTPPYAFQWISSSADLGGMFPPDASTIEYPASPRDGSRVETVRVIVTDANGVQVQASRVVVIDPPGIGLGGIGFFPAVGGVTDYGIERGVSDLCAGQQSAFNARFMPEGYLRRFNFSGQSAWERDFKEGGTGLDATYVDNVDLTFYMGHGYGGGFTFEGNHDDGTLHYSDAVKAWGDKDLEWLALLSCSVMADTYDGKSCITRWGPTFDGLHLMLGFANTAYDSDGFAGTFADWMLGRFHILPPMPVRASWLLATDSNQPGSVIASVMGVIGPAGMSNYNDYFWGKGPVGPDLRGANIQGYWRLKQ